MTTVVLTLEEDLALSVVRFTAEKSWADAGADVVEPQVTRLCLEAQESILAGKWLELASLMLTSAELVFSKESEKYLECIFTVICNLVKKPESLDEAHEMAELISTKIAQQPSDKPALRLKILFNLYNLLENPYSRFFVYMTTLNLAVNGKDQRELFLTISNVLTENKSSAKDAFKFLTKYLATFSGEDAYTMGEAKEEAVRTIIEFVKAPDMFQCDLLDMPAVAQLEKDAKYALAANSTLLKSYGLVHEDCIAKMRLMSLVDLGSDESGQIPYALIKDTLRINDDEVESWVVKAIAAKLIDCKIDHMNQVVIVSHCVERVFGLHQWQTFRTKLATWRANMSNVISTIQANKVTEDGTGAM
ncbi:unnamed protein product [Ilex paraguariensis]|uniref:PCI domain-containing protein n=1 Tax=Ilex paraguariensis TaxID=185542 RepID=A0ABC8R5A6_9AQUA